MDDPRDGGGSPATGGDAFGLVGTTLEGRFKIEGAVAEGGFGVVYRGVHLALGKPVAVKVLKVPEGLGEKMHRDFLESFSREARTIAGLDHPSIVKVLDHGTTAMPHGGVAPWMVLDWLSGRTLEAELGSRRGSGGRPPREALSMFRPILEALATAHEMSIAHRDLKPANVMLVDGSARRGASGVKLMDFGIAKVMESDEGVSRGETRTRASFVAFSPDYAAPEQVSGMRTGPWTDVHAAALILSEMLCDRAPYRSGDAMELQLSVLSPVRPTPATLGVDVGAWEPVLARALSLRPNERYADCGELLLALESTVDSATHIACAAAPPPVAPTMMHTGPETPWGHTGSTVAAGGPSHTGHTLSPTVMASAPTRRANRAWPFALLALCLVGGAAVRLRSLRGSPATRAPRSQARVVTAPTAAAAPAATVAHPAAIAHAAQPVPAVEAAASPRAQADTTIEPPAESLRSRVHGRSRSRASRHTRGRRTELVAPPSVLPAPRSAERIHVE